MAKPVLFVTRRLSASIEALAARDFDARLTPSDVEIPDLPARAGGADAILCCAGDVMDDGVITALPDSVKVIGTFSVGYDHIDLATARARDSGLQHTRRAQRRHRRVRHAADPGGGQTVRRRRAAGAIRHMARLGAHAASRYTDFRPAPRH